MKYLTHILEHLPIYLGAAIVLTIYILIKVKKPNINEFKDDIF